MSFYITTWNAQGAAIADDDKKQILIDLCSQYSDHPHIFILQESGVGRNGEAHFEINLNGQNMDYYQASPEDADNDRCTLSIILPQYIPHEVFNIGNTFVTGRPLMAALVELDKVELLIGNIHACSGNTGEAFYEIKSALDYLNSGNRPWILGGDMNFEASDIKDKEEISEYNLYNPKKPTHNRGSEYDYFFSNTSIKMKNIKNIDVENVAPSDHDPVTALFEF